MRPTTYTSIGIGAAFGTAKSGIGIAGVGTFRPDLIMKVKKDKHLQEEVEVDQYNSPSSQSSCLVSLPYTRLLLQFLSLAT